MSDASASSDSDLELNKDSEKLKDTGTDVETPLPDKGVDPLYWRRRMIAFVLFMDTGFTVGSLFCAFSYYCQSARKKRCM